MSNAIRNYFDCKPLCRADRFLAGLTVAHDAGKFEGFGNPSAIFFAVEINRQTHFFIYTWPLRLLAGELAVRRADKKTSVEGLRDQLNKYLAGIQKPTLPSQLFRVIGPHRVEACSREHQIKPAKDSLTGPITLSRGQGA